MKREFVNLLFIIFCITACTSSLPVEETVSIHQTSTSPENQLLVDAVLLDGLDRLNDSSTLTSFIISHQDVIVFEQYYNGSNGSQSTNVQSITKSVISALMGIAIREGYVNTVDQKLSEFFPTHFPLEDDARKNEITLRHLLTMAAGLKWETDEPMYRSNPLAAILNQPLDTTPGQSFHYNSGLPHILSILISQESGMSTSEFAQQYLFDSIDISLTQWKSVNGFDNGCCELWLTSRDLTKFGQLYLHQGEWDGEQIIPKEWVQESTQFHIEADDEKGYGYYWWRAKISGYDVISALGWGGQFIHVIPELNLVIVGTKNLSEIADPDPYEYNIIEDFIIPSFEKY